MVYLRDWLYELHGRSGMTDHGPAPLSWPALDAWARMTGRKPDTSETDALFSLDAVLLAPGSME